MYSIEAAIDDVQKKIDREKSLIQGAKAMVDSTGNSEVKQRLEHKIREASSNIDYLTNRLNSLMIEKNAPSLRGIQKAFDEKSVSSSSMSSKVVNGKSAFDILLSKAPLNEEIIMTKMKFIQMRLVVEEQCLAGVDKIVNLYSKESKNYEEAAAQREEILQKTRLLKSALKRYKELYIPSDEPNSTASETSIAKNLFKPLTGTVKLTIHAIKNVDHTDANEQSHGAHDTFLNIVVDNRVVCKSRTVQHDTWNEAFVFEMNKARECEVVVYDRKPDKSLPIALLWVPSALILDDSRRKRNLQELSEIDWKMNDSDMLPLKHSSSRTTNASVSTDVASNAGAAPGGDKTRKLLSQVWLSLEPAGQICVSLEFTKKVPNSKVISDNGLGRQGAIRQNKEEVISDFLGHSFVLRQFYQIMRCAVCADFLKDGSGLQCAECSYTCHRRCLMKTINRCIAKTHSVTAPPEGGESLKHHIPHRFEPYNSFSANWCSHCGYFISFLKKDCYKCKECGITCHIRCSRLIPDLCGMSNDMANHILNEIRSTKLLTSRVMKSAASVSKPAAPEIKSPTPFSFRKKSGGVPSISQGLLFATQQLAGSLPEAPPPPRPAIPAHSPSPSIAETLLKPEVPDVKQCSSPSSIASKKGKPRIGLDDFTFLAVLGKGNFGKVMLAEYKHNKRLYAIKVLKKDSILKNNELESLKSEKRVFMTANKEKHPFLLNLFASFQTGTRVYFVMEYIDGGDLMLHIQREQFSLKRAQFYAAEVCLGLKYFHENHIIYRDLKLDNILLCSDGHIKIADYGLCKENMTEGKFTSTFCGTPEFMAPEILLDQQYNRAVDWWAFGVLLYQMILGQSPFKGDDEEEIFEAILNDEPMFPIHMPGEAVDIMQKLLTRDIDKRLGGGPRDALDVMEHPFFRGVDWDMIFKKQIEPTYKPRTTGAYDINNFDVEFTRERPVLTPVNSILSKTEQESFRGFSSFAGSED
ncbi:AGC/PKC protein kinase Pck1 [Schizosaccharomyces japonicus yFS275]|uniref:protein kinase C n=1 Tax=Schizosaccharomyces japonicus (strain yFS275 / FY16936) TaxID=402676 RepID=B6JYW6_SCHJY|nr:AGC/PKC protein kinase Pck1 [Schizosaccharomyces japonicus yFS275]EEB06734.1 AGC/PKC protein kinase Pck1 [Schizosaccharomyces japonicus yFS275]